MLKFFESAVEKTQRSVFNWRSLYGAVALLMTAGESLCLTMFP